jgi:hypothetical protein
MARRVCCCCDSPIGTKGHLCTDCLAEYGKDRTKWPEWLRFLVHDVQREAAYESRHRELYLPDDELFPSERPDPVRASWRYILDEMMP